MTKNLYVLAFFMIAIVGCGKENKMRDDNYFKAEKARYIIDGKRYAVPMGYLWYQHVKYNQWPTPKKTYTETTGFSIDALLPDFTPYSNQNAGQFDVERRPQNMITVYVFSVTSKFKPLEELVGIWKESGSFDQVSSDPQLNQLTQYIFKPGKNPPESSWKEIYLSPDLSNTGFFIECFTDSAGPFPFCKFYDYVSGGGPSYESVFSREYLPHWQEIRRKVITLVDGFVVQ